MNFRFALLAALCAPPSFLHADPDTVPLSGEPLLVPGSFTASDAAAQPVALWLERGQGSLASPAEGETALSLPAQQPSARACLLLGLPEAQPASLRLRLKLAASPAAQDTGEVASAPEILEWELAGVPLRFVGGEAGRWQAEYHTAESGWCPLLAPAGEELGTGWHALTLEFTSAGSETPRQWRLRWDEREPGPWVAQAGFEGPLLVVNAGLSTGLWLDDLAATLPAAVVPPDGNDPEAAAAALAARNAALRQEIAAALAELTRETGVRRVRLRRPVSALAPGHAAGATRSSRLTVLTPLEERQTEPDAPAN